MTIHDADALGWSAAEPIVGLIMFAALVLLGLALLGLGSRW